MSTPDKSLWQLFFTEHSIVLTSALIEEELAHAPRNARRGVAWMHNTFFALIMAKFGSTDAFLAHLLNKAGPNKKGFQFVSQQLAECAKIAEKMQPDCDAATKSLPPALLMMRLFKRMKDWWTVDNSQSLCSQALIHFLAGIIYVALDCPHNPLEKVMADRSLKRTVGIAYIGATGLYLMLRSNRFCDWTQLFDNPFVESKSELPAFSEGAWNVFAVVLTPAEIGCFVKFLSLLIGMLHDWQDENECADREVPDCDALARLDDTIGIIEKFIPEGEALDELASCMTAANTEMQKHGIDGNAKAEAEAWVKSLATTHVKAARALDKEDGDILRSVLIDLADCSRALYRDKTEKELVERSAFVCEDGEPLVLPAFAWIDELKTRLADR